MQYNVLWKVLFVSLFLLLTYLLLIEMAPAPHPSAYKDKVQHVIAFGGVTFWGLMAFPTHARLIMWALALFGGLMEVLQGILTTTRQPSVYDWIADVVGILLAWLVLMLWQRWQQKQRNMQRG